jgi:hypothetical protein
LLNIFIAYNIIRYGSSINEVIANVRVIDNLGIVCLFIILDELIDRIEVSNSER